MPVCDTDSPKLIWGWQIGPETLFKDFDLVSKKMYLYFPTFPPPPLPAPLNYKNNEKNSLDFKISYIQMKLKCQVYPQSQGFA